MLGKNNSVSYEYVFKEVVDNTDATIKNLKSLEWKIVKCFKTLNMCLQLQSDMLSIGLIKTQWIKIQIFACSRKIILRWRRKNSKNND